MRKRRGKGKVGGGWVEDRDLSLFMRLDLET